MGVVQTGELIPDRQRVGTAGQARNQIIADLGKVNHAGGDGQIEFNIVRIVESDVLDHIFDLIVAVADAKYVSIAAIPTAQDVIAGAAIQPVRGAEAREHIVTRRSGDKVELNILPGPDRAIGELEVFDAPIAGVEELTLYGELVVRAGNRDDQVIVGGGTRELHIRGRDVVLEQHGVRIVARHEHDIGVDAVVVIAASEDERVAAAVADQDIVARAAVKRVSGVEAVDRVVAGGLGLGDELGADIVRRPGRAVGEVEFFDFADDGSECAFQELTLNGERLAGVGDRQNQVIATVRPRQQDVAGATSAEKTTLSALYVMASS